MEHFEMNINIWYYLPKEYLNKLPQIFSKMDGWLGSGGYGVDSGFWYSFSTNGDEKYICCCDEPSGLHFNAFIEKTEWEKWKKEFKSIASEIMGYNVGEPELGDCDSDFGNEYAGN